VGTSRPLFALALSFAVACSALLQAAPLDPEEAARIARVPASDSNPHWPLPPAQIEQLIAFAPWEIREVECTGSGVTRPRRLTAYFPEQGATISFKWKPSPPNDADGFNNSPRKEIAAYEIQKWFLDPDSYVVPTSGMRCIPLDEYRARVDAEAGPSFEDARCVLGLAAVWLEAIEKPENFYDDERFRSDPEYARSIAELNLLTYLIQHRDFHDRNMLVAKSPHPRRVFSVDNGIAFGARVFNVFRPHWDGIRVPALPRASVDRLRTVDSARLQRLGTLSELELGPDGVFRAVEIGAAFAPEQGSRREGARLQLGLTRDEIAGVERRRASLLREIDAGRLQVY
jgi:hypothetical protein